MGQYDDLLPKEQEHLPRIVGGWVENGEQPLYLRTWPDEACSGLFKAQLEGTCPDLRVTNVPDQSEFYFQLHSKGYLFTFWADGRIRSVGVEWKGLAYTRYVRMGRLRRHLADLDYDLGADTTLLSRITWAAFSVATSLLGVFLMRSLGWL